MAYLEKNLRRAEALMSDAFLYRDGGEHSLAELLEPGFFPKNQRMMLPGTVGILFGSDGAMWVEVNGHDGTAEQRPVLRPFVMTAETPKPMRKAA